MRPTKPLKSVMCAGSLRAESGVLFAITVKWWIKIPNGETPPGMEAATHRRAGCRLAL